MKQKLAVIAIGGNSLIKDKEHQKVEDQYQAVCETAKHIVDIIEMGYQVVVTHGNGPQVGFIMRRSEIAEEVEHLHPVPLVSCDADTQGAIGYQIQQALQNEFVKRGISLQAVTVVTQVEVSESDPAFENPSKPIGSFYEEGQLESLHKAHPDWNLMKDAGRGYRRVVPSPKPIRVVEQSAIESLLRTGFTVIAVGGGGIPVVKAYDGEIKGVNAVIDKDHASSLLASKLKADLFVISTAVEYVYTGYNTPDEKALKKLTLDELKALEAAGEFAPGSMLPKIQAVKNYIEAGGNTAIITSPDKLKEAFEGKAGTRIER